MTDVAKHALGMAGLRILYDLSHIVPVMVGDADRCNAASNLRLNRHNLPGFTMKVL
jgi:5-aminolevulinate synthase